MNTRFWISMGITVLVLAGGVYASLVPPTILPFDVKQTGQSLRFAITPSTIGMPMPPGLQAGDIIDIKAMAPRDRLVFSNSVGNQLTEAVLNLVVQRGDRVLTIPVHFARLSDHTELFGVFLASLALNWLFTFLGLLLLWRGQRQAAAAVCLWCLLNAFAGIVTSFSLPLVVQGIIGAVATDLLNVGTLLALYLLADDLTGAGVSRRVRARMRNAFILLLSMYVLGLVATQVGYIEYGLLWTGYRLLVLIHLAAFAIPLVLLALFYRRAPVAARARIRWVWASIFIYVASYVVEVFGNQSLGNLETSVLVTLLTALAFLGFTYAVLRHRLVSLRLVLNRALVYGVITTLVVGVFAAISSVIDHFAIGRTESALLQLLVPLTLGVTLSVVKKRLDRFVERLFFQRQYQAEAALSRFARECGFIENRDALLERSVDVIQEYMKPTGVALYEKNENGYNQLRQRGERQFLKHLATDDPAFVSLRAQLAEADLDNLKSALGREGLAFPLAVRGTLLGALVLGQRPAEHYTQNERTLLARISQQLAAALHALHAREAEAFVDAVARGQLGASTETKSRAQQLLSQTLLA
ncbi:MAG TPA: GAF domain-containing protein [Gammaproteobacteria bacterium]|nr:GAF domain-containing protein [Gammaproteobacteria bacterium]